MRNSSVIPPVFFRPRLVLEAARRRSSSGLASSWRLPHLPRLGIGNRPSGLVRPRPVSSGHGSDRPARIRSPGHLPGSASCPAPLPPGHLPGLASLPDPLLPGSLHRCCCCPSLLCLMSSVLGPASSRESAPPAASFSFDPPVMARERPSPTPGPVRVCPAARPRGPRQELLRSAAGRPE
jgi:hypothetical protein